MIAEDVFGPKVLERGKLRSRLVVQHPADRNAARRAHEAAGERVEGNDDAAVEHVLDRGQYPFDAVFMAVMHEACALHFDEGTCVRLSGHQFG